MHIGFDISQTGANKTGCGYFSDALIESLAKIDKRNRYSLYSAFGTAYWDHFHWFNTHRSKYPNANRVHIAFTFGQLCDLWEASENKIKHRLGTPDIIHCNSYFCARPLRDTKIVYTLYDLSFIDYPEYTTELTRSNCFEGMFQASLNADTIVSISNFSKDRFLEIFPSYPEARIQVVYPASRFSKSENHAAKPEGISDLILTERFWLCVGTIEPRKNIRRLLKAYMIAKHQHGLDFPMVIVGGRGWNEEGLKDYITSLGINNDVIMTGYADDAQLIWYYQNCFAFIYPSLYEGFGMPVVEALSLGAAVLTSNTSSIPEVGEDAVIYFNPWKEDHIAAALLKLKGDKNSRRLALKNSAKRQAEKFNWEASAKKMIDIYENVHQMMPYCSENSVHMRGDL